MERNEIYKIIDGERDYQDAIWDGHKHEVSTYILYMEHHLQQARLFATTTNSDEGALKYLRNVVALGVACFEEHGVPERSLEDYR